MSSNEYRVVQSEIEAIHSKFFVEDFSLGKFKFPKEFGFSEITINFIRISLSFSWLINFVYTLLFHTVFSDLLIFNAIFPLAIRCLVLKFFLEMLALRNEFFFVGRTFFFFV